MKSVLELLYEQPSAKTYAQDSPYVQAAGRMTEKMQKLQATLTEEQIELLESYFDDDAEIHEIRSFDHFCYAFHLGAQLMAELIEGKIMLLE